MQAGCVRDTLAWTRTGLAEVGVKGKSLGDKSTRSFVLRTHIVAGMGEKLHTNWWVKVVPVSTGCVTSQM